MSITPLKQAHIPMPRHSLKNKTAPAVILFISANIANVANLIFNMIFARFMGPEMFADLTFLFTLKLGILCVLSAFQLAFAQYTAKSWFGNNRIIDRLLLENHACHIVRKSFGISLPLMFFALVFAESFARIFQFDNLIALFILITIIPVIFPMIIYRGLCQGQINLPRMVGSIQGEWAIRFIGAIILWELGFGLTGIALAVVFSILFGCFLSMTKRDVQNLLKIEHSKPTQNTSSHAPISLSATAPFFALQLAQVLILDGDILLAKANISAEFSGYMAGLMLIQRIFFFAFLSFSSLLIPVISAKVVKTSDKLRHKTHISHKNQRRGRSDLILMLTGIVGISFPALMFLALFPSLGAPLLLGQDFTPIAKLSVISGATGAVFTLTHLCVVFWLANNQTRTAWILLGLAILQMIFLGQFSTYNLQFDIFTFVMLKLSLQSLICVLFLFYTFVNITHWAHLTKRHATAPHS